MSRLPAVINCSECGAAFFTGPNGRNARPTGWRLVDGKSEWSGEILCPRCAWYWFGDADLIGRPPADDLDLDDAATEAAEPTDPGARGR